MDPRSAGGGSFTMNRLGFGEAGSHGNGESSDDCQSKRVTIWVYLSIREGPVSIG